MASALVRDAAAAGAAAAIAIACFVLPYYLLVFCLSFNSLWLAEWVPCKIASAAAIACFDCEAARLLLVRCFCC